MSRHKWEPWINKFGFKDIYKHDCPGDGNCQFSSVAMCLRGLNNCIYTGDEIRLAAAEQALNIGESDVKLIIDSYKAEAGLLEDKKSVAASNEFMGHWSPKHCETAGDLSNAILLPYNFKPYNYMAFQGDNFTLSLIQKHYGVNILIFDEDRTSYINMNDEKYEPTIILLQRSIGGKLGLRSLRHYLALSGIYKDEEGDTRIRTLFYPDTFPKEISDYLKIDAYERRQREKKRKLQELAKRFIDGVDNAGLDYELDDCFDINPDKFKHRLKALNKELSS